MTRRGNLFGALGFLLLALSLTVPAFPQAAGATAELRGKVTDQSGGVLPGVTVTLTDAARGTTRTAVTDDRGEYAVPLLPPSV